MKKKTKLFKHFMTVLNIIAFGAPLFILVINVCRDVFPKLFASWSVQHHGGTSDVFSNDLDYSVQKMQFNDFNDTILTTLDNFDYLNYDSQTRPFIQYLYQTNEVDDLTDLVIGNAYVLTIDDALLEVLVTNNLGDYYPDDQYYDFEFEYIFSDLEVFKITKSGYNDLFLEGYTSLPFNYPFNFTEIYLYGNGVYWDIDGVDFYDFTFNINYSNFTLNIGIDSAFYIYTTLDNDLRSFVGQIDNYYEYSLTNFISECPIEYIPVSVTYPEVDITSLSEWKAYYNGKNFDTVVNQGCDTKMLLNFDFGKIFFKDTLINNSGNIAPYLLLNYMINYVINIGLFLFLPECLIILFSVLRSFTYKAIDDEAYR